VSTYVPKPPGAGAVSDPGVAWVPAAPGTVATAETDVTWIPKTTPSQLQSEKLNEQDLLSGGSNTESEGSQSWVPKDPNAPPAIIDPSESWVAAENAVGNSGWLSAINDTGALVVPGMPIQRTANDKFVLARAGSALLPTLRCQGIAIEGKPHGHKTKYVFNGQLVMSNWTAITGTMLLTPGAIYYLGAVPGTLTETKPERPDFALFQVVGHADDERTLDINPDVYEVDL